MPKLSRLLALLLVVVFAACSSAPIAPTPAPPTTAAVLTIPAPSQAPRPTTRPPVTAVPETPAPPSALVLWAIAQGPELDALRALIGDLSIPLGAQVVVVGKTADGLLADLRADALAGLPPPDLIWGTQDELGLLQQDGMLQPPADGLDDGTFLPAVLAGATVGEQRWGTPVAAQGYLLLLFNRKLADNPPRTTDDLIARARQLTGGGRYGMVAAWAEPRWFTAWLHGFGGQPIDAAGAPTLDTPQMIAAMNLLKELRGSGPPPPVSYQDGVRTFRRGEAAFAIDGDWSLERYRAYSETLDLGIAPLPAVPATGRPATSTMGGIYLMFNRALSAPGLEQGRALARALVEPGSQARIARKLHRLPALRAALTDPAVTGDPALAAAAQQAEGAPGLPPTKQLRCAWDAIRAQLPPVILGEQSQEEAASAMQSSAQRCLEQST
jgi:arabinogalactan oligomer / maltooligosaccharide transport system substrate-binding protein